MTTAPRRTRGNTENVMTTQSNAEKTPGTGLVVLANSPQALANYDYGDDGDSGFEGGKDAVKMPWLRLAQGLTPQVETLDGLKAGHFFNTVTNEVYPGEGGYLFVPVLFNEAIVEWEDRKEGGGYVGQHDSEGEMYKAAVSALPNGIFSYGTDGKIIRPQSPEGNDLIDTKYVWGLYVNEATGDIMPAAIAFTSTHINSWKEWYTMAAMQTYLAADGSRKKKPPFAHVYRVTSKKKTGEGNTWYVPQIAFAKGGTAKESLTAVALHDTARGLLDVVKKGAQKIDYGQQGGKAEAVAGGAATGGKKAGNDKDIPF